MDTQKVLFGASLYQYKFIGETKIQISYFFCSEGEPFLKMWSDVIRNLLSPNELNHSKLKWQVEFRTTNSKLVEKFPESDLTKKQVGEDDIVVLLLNYFVKWSLISTYLDTYSPTLFRFYIVILTRKIFIYIFFVKTLRYLFTCIKDHRCMLYEQYFFSMMSSPKAVVFCI